MHLRFPALPLLKGIYFVDTFVLCEQALHIYDRIVGVNKIEVEQDGLEQGVVFLRHEWNDGARDRLQQASRDARDPDMPRPGALGSGDRAS